MKTPDLTKPIHRSPLRRALLLIAPALVIIAVSTAVPARATPACCVTTEIILGRPNIPSTWAEIDIYAKTDLNFPNLPPDWWKAMINTNGASDLYVVRNTFPPGAHTGWHSHPGPSLVTVTCGTITAYDGDDPTCTPHRYSAGSTFIDPTSNGHVHLVRNETSQTAVTVAVQLVPAGVSRRTDVSPAPVSCLSLAPCPSPCPSASPCP